MARIVGGIAATVFAVLLVVYGSFALYEGSWSLAKHNLQHSLQLQQQNANGQASIAVNGWNYQSTLGHQITDGITNVTHDSSDILSAQQQGDAAYANQLKAQREYDANKVCDFATQVNGSLPQGMFQTAWINTNCANGSLKQSSEFYYSGSL